MILFFSGSMPVIEVQPERATPEKKPAVMLTYFEVKDNLFGAGKRFRGHVRRIKRKLTNDQSVKGKVAPSTTVS